MANENIQELKFQVGEAWKGVYSSSTAYGLANVVQDATGLSIYRSLKSGNVGHPVSDRTWWFCIIDLSSIKAESDRIAALNEAIAQDEALRVAAEELRQQHEQARVDAESARATAEQQRITAEQARVNAESARATAEQQRITAEQGRVSAESARVQAEQARALAETLRANAEDARAAAEINRNAAEQQRIANEQARETQYAADHSRAEADHETAVQDNAQMTELVERADADHDIAEADHTRAESDHTTAASDHTQAGSDHTTAAADHTQAGSDHTRAEEDHTRSESDHAAVELYVDSLGAFDISAYHATGGVLAKYADLTAALGTNGANIPEAIRKGGMSVKFVLSSDNKYVQYRLMSNSFNTTIANWQGVDSEPTDGSDNLVKSGGVAERNNTYNFQAHKSLFGEVLRNKYLTNSGVADTISRNNIAVTSYIKLNGDDIEITKVYYSQYGPVIAFYDINKTFKHYWNPTGETYDTIIPVTVPASEIQSDDYYVRATIADDGLFVSGFDNLAITSQKANDALLPSLITLSGADRKSGKYIDLSGNEANTTLNKASASPFIIIDGNDIVISQMYYAPGYNCGIAFYDKNKIFTHQYTPDNLNRDINKDVIIPNSVIQTGDMYARTTLWGNGTITSGFKTLAQKAEDDIQKAFAVDLLALFGEDKKVRYYIGQNGEEQYSGRTDIAVSPYYPLNGEELVFSRIMYSEYGKAVSFYDETKAFISGWNPTGGYGKIAVTVPVSDIPSSAVYARVTLADDGEITDGYLTLAQKAENDAQKALEQVLPTYWLSFLASKLPLIHTNQEDNVLNGDSFYFLTDYHIESNAGYSHKIIQYLCEKTTVQNMVYGGDSFNGSTTKDSSLEKLREFYYRFYPINMFGLRGNHEFNLNNGGGQAVKLSDNQVYNYLMRKTANEVVAGVVSPMYYYRDVDKLKLRYIYLDARYENNTDPIDDTQIQWMKDRITELQSDWSVILFSHQLFTIVSPGAPVVTNPGYNASGTKIINALTSITPAAEIIAIIAGHCHYDFSTDEHGFLEISTTCDARQEYGGLPQALGTPNEQAFDVFSLNLEARTLKAVRIGRGSDRSWSY